MKPDCYYPNLTKWTNNISDGNSVVVPRLELRQANEQLARMYFHRNSVVGDIRVDFETNFLKGDFASFITDPGSEAFARNADGEYSPMMEAHWQRWLKVANFYADKEKSAMLVVAEVKACLEEYGSATTKEEALTFIARAVNGKGTP